MKKEIFNIHKKTKIEIKESKESDEYPLSWIKIFFKRYPRFKSIKLPRNISLKGSLANSINSRKSIRTFNEKKITIKEISTILHFSAGIINMDQIKDLNESRRAYPSAGARYPNEIYLLISNCSGIDDGLYHYNVVNHSLELMIKGKLNDELNTFVKQDMIINASITFMITGVFNRTQIKYGTRAYRYMLLDSGHLAQNIYLVSNNLNIGCCTIGGFTDEKINQFLDLDENEQTLYMGVLGKYDQN